MYQRQIYNLLQKIPYINMSYSHIMWCYYRQYIPLWGMVWLLINVFDHVSHYCHHMWSSTWVMRLSFLYEDKGEVHPLCTLNVRQIAFAPLSPLALKAAVAVVMGAAMRRVHVRLCGRRCRASAGCPESTVLLRYRPAGCGRPARNPLRPERGSSHSARNTQRMK